MKNLAITVKTVDRPGVLNKITEILVKNGINITYANIHVLKTNMGKYI